MYTNDGLIVSGVILVQVVVTVANTAVVQFWSAVTFDSMLFVLLKDYSSPFFMQ